MAWTWYNSVVTKIVDESPTTKRFWLKVEEGKPTFKAGQFVTMDLPIHEKRLKRWRSYSIANAPGSANDMEFCIVRLEGGLASDYFFEEVAIGTPIKFKGPTGAFILKEPIDKDLILICTGTGVAPFRSMLHDIIDNNKPHKKIHLIFGTRYKEGILYEEEFSKLEETNDFFSYTVCLSREENLEDLTRSFELSKGYVHQAYKKHYLDPKEDVAVYLCGWKNMVDEAVETFMDKLGYQKEQIHYELYG